MEALSLGLLAFATGGFLLKARANARANKKEGFTNDSLFGSVVQNTMPQIHKEFVADSLTYFNPFASILNINKTNVVFNSSNADINWSHDAPDNATSANLFRSLYSKPGPNGRDFAINDELGEKYATKYRVPKSNPMSDLVNKCENTDVKGPLISEITDVNGVKTQIYEGKCSAFNDTNGFSNVCGICHSGECKDAVGSNISINDMPKGLFVSSRLKLEPSQEKQQMEALKDNRNLRNMLVSPSLGTCGIDSNINKNLFSIDEKSCIATNNYLKCKHKQDFSSPGCYMCSTDGRFYFIDNKNDIFSVRQPTTFTLGGNGIVTLQLYGEDGVTQSGYLGNPDSNGFLTLSSTSNSINLQQLSNTSLSLKIPLTSDGEAAAGKYLMIDLRAPSNNTLPYVQGVFLGSLRSNSAQNKTDFTATASDITSGTNNVFYTSANYGMKMKPAIYNGVQRRNAIFKIVIPFLYISTSNIESTYCSGPFIKNANSSNILSNSDCYKGIPGTYNKECLQGLFLTAGCTSNGLGFPSTDEKANALKLRVQNAIGSNANQGDIIDHVYSHYQRSLSGLDSRGAQLTATEWVESQKFCTDSNITYVNPCESLAPTIKENGPLSEECISYIYTNGYYSDSSNISYGTYTSKPQAASLFGESNSMSSNIRSQIETFVGSSKKDRFCTEFGNISPLAGGSNMENAKTMGGITNLKAFYNNIHMKANQTDMTNAERAQYVAQCYGTDLNVEATADPTIRQGMETSSTTCGTGGLSRGNRTEEQDQGTFNLGTNALTTEVIGPIRGVRVWNNSTEWMNFSQLVVLDSRGQNVALKKKTTQHSNLGGSGGSAAIVDGTLSIRNHPSSYHSADRGSQEYVEIDLEGLYDIVQIIFFNRGDCCQDRAIGIQIALYNNETFLTNTPRTRNNARYISAPLTNAPIQYINFSHPNSSPASCPRMLSGQRGNLLAGQTTINNVRNVLTTPGSTPYPIYNLNTSLPRTLGGDSNARSGITETTIPNAKWIWNHPYAEIKARAETVRFYTNIYNNTNVQQKHYLYYRCDDSVTSIIFNGVVLPNAPSGNWAPENRVGSSVMLLAIPGQNTLEVHCNNILGKARFIAAIYRSYDLSWISVTDSTQTNYYSASNAANTNGYSWRSYSAPNIGAADAGIFTDTGTPQTKYELTNLPGYLDNTNRPSAKWIWNQPDAAQFAKKPDTVQFYFYINVNGTAIINYTLHLLSGGVDNQVDRPNAAIAINNSNIDGLIGHINYKGPNSMDTKNFPVVPGRNLLQVSITTSGQPGLAMFKAYISDNNGNAITGSDTASNSLWVCTTGTEWSSTNPCIYVPNNATNVPYNCASKIWGSNCTQGFSSGIYNGDPATHNGTLNTKTKAELSTELYNYWGNGSVARGVTAVEKLRQERCRGISVCPTGSQYNSSSDAAAGKCTPNGLANSVCPNGYTYVSGFDANSCQKTTAQTRWTRGTSNVPWRTCASLNDNQECGPANYSQQSDGSCYWSKDRICYGSCAYCPLGGRNLSKGKSFAERKSGISCPAGYTSNGEDTNNLFCIQDIPNNVESFVTSRVVTTPPLTTTIGGTVITLTPSMTTRISETFYGYKCESGSTRQSDGSCLGKTSPDNSKYSTPRLPN